MTISRETAGTADAFDEGGDDLRWRESGVDAVLIALDINSDLQRMLEEASDSLVAHVLQCNTYDDAWHCVQMHQASVIVLRQSCAADAAALQGLRNAEGQATRLLLIGDGAGELPWDAIDDVVASPVDERLLRLRLRSLIGELCAHVALDNARHHQDQIARVMQNSRDEMIERLELAEAESKTAYLDLVFRLSMAAEVRDGETAEHLHRMSQYSQIVGQAMGLSDDEVFILGYASMMHDVGKIAIPDAVLFKPGRLNRQEWDIMKGHTTAGARIVGDARNPLLQASAVIAEGHHEKWDGSGYPHGLAGEDIPLFARIVAIADVFDALTTRRCYKPAYDNETAYRIIREGTGTHFAPAVVDAFFSKRAAIERIQKQTAQSLIVGPKDIPAAAVAASDDF